MQATQDRNSKQNLRPGNALSHQHVSDSSMFFRICTLPLLLCLLAITATAQEYATLSGYAVDQKDGAIPAAAVTLTHLRRGSTRNTTTNATGIYLFDSVEPGDYSLTVKKENFATYRIDLITLQARDRKSVRVQLEIATTTTTVTIVARSEGVTSDSSGGAVLEQDFLKHLPVNGRNVSALMQTAPGVVTGGPGGGINVNGLRANTNYFMLDGVSLSGSTPVGGGGLRGVGGGGAPGGGGPGGGVGGSGAADLLSLDSLQEIRIQTSAFAPEFGRTPGAQVTMSSRGGTNDFHGSLYEYWRNHNLNANDWFANREGFARGRMSQHQLGATFGGKVISNKTFFFLSGEVLRLRAPDTAVVSVPDLTTRRSARANLRPYLNAFPIPNGPRLDGGAAQFSAVFTNPQNRESWGARLDHSLNKRNSIFFRYNFTPGNSVQRASTFVSPNTLTVQDSKSQSATVSLTTAINPYSTNDLRVNYSRTSFRNDGAMDNFGGAVPLTDAQVFPRNITSAIGSYTLSILGASSLSLSQHSRNDQTQINIVDSLTMIAGTHAYKMGVDLRTIAATTFNPIYSVNAVFNGLSGQDNSFLTGSASTAVISSSLPAVYPSTMNWSYYLQDTWRVDDATTISYGVRWDVNPAPTTRQGPRPLALASNRTDRVTQSEGLYNTRWTDLAPRVGISHQLSNEKGKELMFRGGFGFFYDLGYGTSLAAFSGAPYVNARTLTGAPFPLTAGDLTSPVLPPSKPYNQIGAAERNLQSPRTMQWNATLERSLGFGQVFSLGYVGTSGSRLLRTETRVSFSDDFDLLRVATNGAASSYHGLQAQLRRRLGDRLLLQGSYTWSHSIDTASNDTGFGGGFATLFTSERGNSDYDLRHNLNVSGSYLLPSTKAPALKWLTNGWWSDFVFSARTGLSFDILGLTSASSNSTATTPGRRGLFAQVRPNYNGKPVWISDSSAPGGRRLNKDAFVAPSGFGQGSLGRNSIGGYRATQLDLTVRREIKLGEQRALHLSVQGFNLSNHPNFSNPAPNEGANLASSNFGITNRMLNQGFGGGLGSIYRSGGPRSLQVSMRFQF